MALNKETLALAEAIRTDLSIDAQGTGTSKIDLYNTHLPEDLTPQIVTRVSDYNSTFTAAGTYAFGQVSAEAMRADPNLTKTGIDIPMGNDTLKIGVERERSWKNPTAPDGPRVVKHAVVSTAYEVRAGRNAGQLKAAREAISELGAEYLK